MKINHNLRIRLISLGIILIAGLLVSRLFFLQVVRGEVYSAQADSQYFKPVGDAFDRGSIFFTNRDGSPFSVATTQQGFTIAINPSVLEKPSEAYESLNKIIPIDKQDFDQKASKKTDPYEELVKKVPLSEADQIKALGISGVVVKKEKWRFYPGGSLASHVVGFMGYKGDEYAGRYGLEKYYEDILRRGQGGSFVSYFAEIFLGAGKKLSGEFDHREGDLVSSIEPTVQQFVEKTLKEALEKYSASAGGAIVMDPMTGEIVAMASWPSYDPGKGQSDVAILSNPLVESVFEMGSTIKPLTVAAGLDTGAITADTTYYDAGSVQVRDATIKNYDGEGRGTVPMQETLNQSLNTGMVFIVDKMGHEKFQQYILAYGVGEKTGIDLPDEVAGLVSNIESGRPVELSTASFGQGFALTPIATTRALATLANGGQLVKPYLVKQVKYENGFNYDVKPTYGRRVIKRETSEEITRMLVTVVDDALLGGTVKMDSYTIAAKTGTAQIAREDGRGYYDDRYLHTFFGYFPAYEPRFIVFLYAQNPKEVRYASQTLTAPFMEMAKYLLNYYQIPPDR